MATDILPIWSKLEQEAFLSEPNNRYFCGKRNRAIILLMLRCGLRVSECVGRSHKGGGGLRVSDVDLNTGRIQIRDAKDTRKKRIKADGTPVKRRNRAGRVVYADRETLATLTFRLLVATCTPPKTMCGRE